MVIYPDEYWYLNIKDDNIETIFTQSIMNNEIVNELIATTREFDEIKRIRLK